MAAGAADRTTAAVVWSRARWVILPAGVVIALASLAIYVVGGDVAALSTFVVLLLLMAIWRTLLREPTSAPRQGQERGRGPARPARRTGAAPPVRRRLPSSISLGVHTMVRSTRVLAWTPAALPDLQLRLARALADEAVPCTWYPTPDGSRVDWRVRAEIRNETYLLADGELRPVGEQTRFTGVIHPDGVTVFGILFMVVFGIGGVGALIAGVRAFVTASGSEPRVGIALPWGVIGCTVCTLWASAQARAFEVHERILCSVFGADLRLGTAATTVDHEDEPAPGGRRRGHGHRPASSPLPHPGDRRDRLT